MPGQTLHHFYDKPVRVSLKISEGVQEVNESFASPYFKNSKKIECLKYFRLISDMLSVIKTC